MLWYISVLSVLSVTYCYPAVITFMFWLLYLAIGIFGYWHILYLDVTFIWFFAVPTFYIHLLVVTYLFFLYTYICYLSLNFLSFLNAHNTLCYNSYNSNTQ